MDRVKKCENCRHFFYDNSTGASDCGQVNEMSEEDMDPSHRGQKQPPEHLRLSDPRRDSRIPDCHRSDADIPQKRCRFSGAGNLYRPAQKRRNTLPGV